MKKHGKGAVYEMWTIVTRKR